MVILLVSADDSKSIFIGGKHIHQELFERGLRESGHRVIPVYPEAVPFFRRVINKIGRLSGLLKTSSIYISYISHIRKSLVKKIRIICESEKIDYISVQDVLSAIAVGIALERKAGPKPPIIMTLHGYFTREAINYGYFKPEEQEYIRTYGMEIERKALEISSGVITVDTRICNYILDEFRYKKPIKVFFNAIDDTRFGSVGITERNEIREKLGISTEQLLLFVARRLVKKNGVIYAVQALRKLIQDGKTDLHMYIAGVGPESDAIKNYIEQESLTGHVSLLGMVPHSQINSWYKACDIILMPSTKSDDVEEATSLSMLEGMICGKVVIATAIGGLKEVIKNGVNGILTDDKSPDQIAEKITSLIENSELYESLSRNAYLYTKENHGFREHARRIFEFFTTI